MILELVIDLIVFVKDVFFDLFFNVFSEIFKFCLVLLMAYAIALGIFYFWIEIMRHEQYLQQHQHQQRPTTRQSQQSGTPLPKTPMPKLPTDAASATPPHIANNDTDRKSSHTPTGRPTEPNETYPNIVEIPSKLSVDMEKPQRRSKEPQRPSITMEDMEEKIEEIFEQIEDTVGEGVIVMATAATTEEIPTRNGSGTTLTETQ